MKITLICVGKLKEKYLSQGVDEYVKRLGRYCNLKIIQLQDEKTPDNASEAMELMIKKKEGERILKALKHDSYVIALAIEGKMLSSEELAKEIETLGVSGTSHISFIIGGSLGLSQEVLNRADEKLSFSKMTFPHQLMRMILLEQVYRAYRINNHQPYHK
ncbi:MAG: 23S rRNA (pseudouridine(1915)-N(3))-methyltransferase RlmH [Clostridiales bacterium]|nr:23S rRNA (pseudouridine(1915)-N(3))-methyltransferase RlmH [Clostridiales bacterium]